MNHPVRRSFIVTPENGLLLTPDAFQAWENSYTFMQTTGIEPEGLVPSIICSAPIPRYFPKVDSPRRFSHVSAKYMWHPFFWLPPHLAQRVSMPLPNGEPYFEDWDTYALRIVLEMGNSGVFNRDGWVDILAPLGINTDTAEGVRRIERWQAGNPDPALDYIDTTDLYRAPSDPMWSVKLSRMLAEPTVKAQHHRIAVGFLEAVEGLEASEAVSFYQWISTLATIYLRNAQFPEGVSGEEFWERMVQEANSPRFEGNGEHFLNYRGRYAKQWLENLVNDTEGNLEYLHKMLSSIDEVAA